MLLPDHPRLSAPFTGNHMSIPLYGQPIQTLYPGELVKVRAGLGEYCAGHVGLVISQTSNIKHLWNVQFADTVINISSKYLIVLGRRRQIRSAG